MTVVSFCCVRFGATYRPGKSIISLTRDSNTCGIISISAVNQDVREKEKTTPAAVSNRITQSGNVGQDCWYVWQRPILRYYRQTIS